MEDIWRNFGATILRKSEHFEEQHPEITPRKRAEEVHLWEDYALETFTEPALPSMSVLSQ